MNEQAETVIYNVRLLVSREYHGNFREAFDAYDRDDDGLLSADDISRLLKDAGVGNWLTRGAWVSGVLTALDTNHDGFVSVKELTDAIEKNGEH